MGLKVYQMKVTIFTVISVLLSIFVFGCSSSFDPIQTQETNSEINLPLNIPIETNSSNRNLLGMWTINFDSKTLQTDIAPYRDVSGHLNVSSHIPSPIINGVSYNPLTGIWDID